MGKTQILGSLVNTILTDSSNNVGIGGAANTSYKLQVTGTTNLTGALSGTSAVFSGNILLQGGTGFLQYAYNANTASRSWRISSDQVAFGDFAIQQTASQTGSDFVTKFYINPTGNVGIGTNSPDGKLHIYGKTYARYGQDDMFAFYYDDNYRFGITNPSTDLRQLRVFGKAADGNSFLVFATGNDTERMRITSTGNVAIGTTSPFAGAKLQVKTATNINVAFQTGTADTSGIKLNAFNDAADTNIPIELNGSIMILKTNETERMRILSGGDIELKSYGGNTNLKFQISGGDQFNTRNGSSGTPMYLNLQGNGAIYAGAGPAATLYAGSDERIKENINVVDSTLDKVMQLIPKTFNYKEVKNNNLYYGFIAQDMESVFPELVKTADGITMCNDEEIEGQKSIEPFGLVWASILTKAIQELTQKVNALENK
jgi:hypothetical protein